MKKLLFGLAAILIIAACKPDKKAGVTFTTPEAGTAIKAGEPFAIRLDFGDENLDSVVYLLDSSVVARKKDTSTVKATMTNVPMGSHLVTARVYSGGVAQEVSSNIVLVPANAPQQYSFSVVNTFPHDTASYVEGLEYHDGLLYESDGGYTEHGGSSLRVVKPETGRILKQIKIDSRYFAEGITVVGDKIIQLTYKEGVGFVYDKTSLKKLSEFPYTAGREGWGMAFDGQQILNTSDGSNEIHFMNKDSYQKERTIEVYDNNGPIDNLNELEYINDKIYANVYTKPWILIINRSTGAVEGKADLSQLLPKGDDADYVLNGIAWDAKGKRMFVTGKLWDKLYEIKLKPLN